MIDVERPFEASFLRLRDLGLVEGDFECIDVYGGGIVAAFCFCKYCTLLRECVVIVVSIMCRFCSNSVPMVEVLSSPAWILICVFGFLAWDSVEYFMVGCGRCRGCEYTSTLLSD